MLHDAAIDDVLQRAKESTDATLRAMAGRDDHTDQRLLLPASEAARLLSISEKTLWSNTSPRGSIPAVRLGRSVRYSRAALERWIAGQTGEA